MSAPPQTQSRVSRRQSRQKKQSTRVVKLIVTGLSQSGKTDFIETISQYTEWQDIPGNSWFFGRVRVDNSLILHFLEPPIERQFDFMWLREVMSRIRATGFVVMLDSTRPQNFGEFLSIVYTIRGYHENAPLVVAANKQNKRYAWSPEDIQLGLGIRDISVKPCEFGNRDQVREIVLELLYQVMT
jgi:hypothetical protein